MLPTWSAPISSTRYLVVGVTRSTVRGRPTSLLKEPAGTTVSPSGSRSWPSRSLVVVLPTEPVTATTRSSPAARTRARTEHASSPSAVWTSSTTTHGRPSSGRAASTSVAPPGHPDLCAGVQRAARGLGDLVGGQLDHSSPPVGLVAAEPVGATGPRRD